jgi:hypothetical protein
LDKWSNLRLNTNRAFNGRPAYLSVSPLARQVRRRFEPSCAMIKDKAVVIDPKNEPLVLDLVEWIAREPRDYAEVMEAWRTSCPKLAIWEDASDRGLVARERVADRLLVVATTLGHRLLETSGRRSVG